MLHEILDYKLDIKYDVQEYNEPSNIQSGDKTSTYDYVYTSMSSQDTVKKSN